jgi:hypothetical protein
MHLAIIDRERRIRHFACTTIHRAVRQGYPKNILQSNIFKILGNILLKYIYLLLLFGFFQYIALPIYIAGNIFADIQ